MCTKVQKGNVRMRSLNNRILRIALSFHEITNRPATCPETTEMLHMIQMCVTESSLVLDIDSSVIFINPNHVIIRVNSIQYLQTCCLHFTTDIFLSQSLLPPTERILTGL